MNSTDAPTGASPAGSSSADPRVSAVLMTCTYIAGGVALAVSFASGGSATTAAYWASAGCVGAVGLLSFVRHSIFHRSDAARMGWDYGRRNDFQIEVGLANLSWGIVGILAWVLDWGAAAAGAITLSFGIYMLSASALHLSEVARPAEGQRPRVGPAIASTAFAIALLAAGAAAVSA